MLAIDIYRRLPMIELRPAFQVAGEILALFGPSGAGKSMTLKLIAGIETADAGCICSGERILFDASAGINVPPQQRRVGYVPQHYALFPHLTALENVAFPLRKGLGWPATRAISRATELLDTFDLRGHHDTKPNRLSGGQQQRVALARALAVEPEILLLDEPFAALDAPIRIELRQELRAVQQRLRVPAIFVTHDLEEAATVADRLAVMIAGEIRQIDRTRVVLDRPADREVAQLVQARNVIPGDVQQVDGGTIVRSAIGELHLDKRLLDNGSPVDVIIRPEVIRIVRDDRPLDRLKHGVLLEGLATEVVDHGTRATVYAQCRGVSLEVSLSPSAASRLDLIVGAPIRLSVAPSDVHIVRAARTVATTGTTTVER